MPLALHLKLILLNINKLYNGNNYFEQQDYFEQQEFLNFLSCKFKLSIHCLMYDVMLCVQAVSHTFHINISSSSTFDPGNMGRPLTISNNIHPTPLR